MAHWPDLGHSLPVIVDVDGAEPLYFNMDVEGFAWSPIASVRDAVDQTAEPGEQAIVPTGLWKRTRGNWKLGEGQEYADEPGDSDDLRYYESRGVDPWDQRKLKLLADTEQALSTSETTGKLVALNNAVVWLDGTTLRYSTSPSTGDFTDTVTGAYTDIAQYGTQIIAATGTATKRISDFSTTPTVNDLGADAIDYVVYGNGRLLGMHDNVISEIDSAGTKTDLWTHPNTDFIWKGGVATPNGLYVFGTAGKTSELFYIGIDDTSTALFAPYVAAPLPENEEVHTLYHYGGVVIIGTERGFRLANITGGGHLSYGPLIPVGPVKQFAGKGEDLWYTWADYETNYTGLGRTRLDKGTDLLVPRYASDVMAYVVGGGASLAAATYEDDLYFVISGDGLYRTTGNKVASGWYNSGWVTYGTPELKEVHSLDLRHEPLPAGSSVVGKIIKEDSSEVTVATSNTTNGVSKIGDVTSKFLTEQVQVRIELNRATDTTTGPEFRRWTLRAICMPNKQAQFILPLFLSSKVKGPRGQEVHDNALSKWNALRTLEAARQVINVQIGDFTVQARIDGVGISNGDARQWARNQEFVEGIVSVRFETAENLGS